MKQVIIIRNDLGMSKGKIAAQASHASMSNALKIYKKDRKLFDSWEKSGQKKVVLKLGSKTELVHLYDRVRRKLTATLIRDAGLTQLNPGECTALAIGPDEDTKIDEFVKELKLL